MQTIVHKDREIKIWADEVESGAMQQLKNLAEIPFVFKWVCAMPDVHQGYGMPIGGVAALKDAVIPNAVGVDIGCGMRVIKTELTDFSQNKLKQWLDLIDNHIPMGFEHRKKKVDLSLMPEADKKNMPVISQQFESAREQLGTLGGGNHFMEVQKGDDGYIWVMLHSGSRHLGLQVAEYHNKVAKRLARTINSPVPEKYDLAYLPVDSKEGESYLKEMQFCLNFARNNRKMMMNIINDIIEVNVWQEIDIHHNFSNKETHFGQEVWVHRKGATSAFKGQLGIIPGSMGTPSYIVEGLGNTESFMSCAHGAGRCMSRNKTFDFLDKAQVEKSLQEVVFKGWSKMRHGRHKGKYDMSEAPQAYKNIDKVIAQQQDLIKVLVKLKPIGVLKA